MQHENLPKAPKVHLTKFYLKNRENFTAAKIVGQKISIEKGKKGQRKPEKAGECTISHQKALTLTKESW